MRREALQNRRSRRSNGLFGGASFSSGLLAHREVGPPRIMAPGVLSFRDNDASTSRFLGRIRREIDVTLKQKNNLIVDPASIHRINPAAALCLLAEFDRWQRLRDRGPLYATTVNAWNREVTRRLADMGFFELLGTEVPARLRLGGAGAARFIRFISNDSVDPESARAFRLLVGEPLMQPSEMSLGLYRSLSEAIANAVEHAYPASYLPPETVGRRWWLTGSVNATGSRLRVVVLDHGVSIPASLPQTKRGIAILERLRLRSPGEALDDGLLIEAAMEYGRSSSEQPQRGKGLEDILGLARADPTNRLRVISRRGRYVWKNDRGHAFTQRYPLNGTLIEWDLALPPRLGNGG
jgi:hypothetical protein